MRETYLLVKRGKQEWAPVYKELVLSGVNFEILRAKSASLRGRQNRQEEGENAHLTP
jgi:hypothetical protein